MQPWSPGTEQPFYRNWLNYTLSFLSQSAHAGFLYRLVSEEMPTDEHIRPHELALIVNSPTHFRMWYLTDRSTPAGLSLCLRCGLLATSNQQLSQRNGEEDRRRVWEGRGTASILLLPRAPPPRTAAQQKEAKKCGVSHILRTLTHRITMTNYRLQRTIEMTNELISCEWISLWNSSSKMYDKEISTTWHKGITVQQGFL